MDDVSQAPKGDGEIEKRTSLVGKEFQDVSSEIEIDGGKVPPEQAEREKRLEKRLRSGLDNWEYYTLVVKYS